VRLSNASFLLTITVLMASSVPAFAQEEAFDPRDISGVWALAFTPGGPQPFGPDRPPMTPEGDVRYLQNIPTASNDPRLRASGDPADSNDPTYACNPIGFPRTLHDEVVRMFEIVQIEDRVLQLLQRRRTLREFWMDGRTLPSGENLDNIGPSWFGHSVAEWQGNELVVNTVGLDDRAWLDALGNVKSFEARVEERIRRVDADTLEISMTLHDPAFYTAPWVGRTLRFRREPADRLTYFGWYGLFSGVADLMCAPMNFIELRREGGY